MDTESRVLTGLSLTKALGRVPRALRKHETGEAMPLSQHRLALAGILLVVVAIPLMSSAPAGAEATPPRHPIVATALKYEGTYGGECWTFMKKVVKEATGREVGFDYRDGYLDAGAVEVKARDAQAGDIIQIADDRNTTPSADYSGLHTALVIDNLGDGTFNVIDSNSSFDGMIRVRSSYSPAAAAARYGIQFHIYRIGVGPIPPQPLKPPVAPQTTTLRLGDKAIVSAGGDCLNMRSGAGVGQPVITCLPDRSSVTVTANAVSAGGRLWLKVSTTLGEGWVAAEFLSPVGATGSAASPTNPLLQFRSFVPQISSN